MLGIEDILAGAGMFALIFAKSWYANWQKTKILKKTGENNDSIMIVPNDTFNKYEYIFGGIGIIILGISCFVGYKSFISGDLFHNFGELFKSFSFGLATIYAPIKFKRNYNIIIGEKGFIFRNIHFIYDEIEKIVWDKDINQKLWGLNVIFKKQISHHKIYINRKYKDQFEKIFQEKVSY